MNNYTCPKSSVLLFWPPAHCGFFCRHDGCQVRFPLGASSISISPLVPILRCPFWKLTVALYQSNSLSVGFGGGHYSLPSGTTGTIGCDVRDSGVMYRLNRPTKLWGPKGWPPMVLWVMTIDTNSGF